MGVMALKLCVDNKAASYYNMIVLLRHAPLAQLVEHLTLNQGVLGSSPRWRTSLNLATMPLQGFLFYSLYFEVTPWL